MQMTLGFLLIWGYLTFVSKMFSCHGNVHHRITILMKMVGKLFNQSNWKQMGH